MAYKTFLNKYFSTFSITNNLRNPLSFKNLSDLQIFPLASLQSVSPMTTSRLPDKPNIVILDSYSNDYDGVVKWEGLKALGNLKTFPRMDTEEQTKECVKDAHVIISNKVVMGKKFFDYAPNCRYVGKLATGYNEIDLTIAKERGIAVANVPDYSSESVAQHVLYFILDHAIKGSSHAMAVRNGDWFKSPDYCLQLGTNYCLSSRTLLIVGLGSIGKKVKEFVEAIGMRVVVAQLPNRPKMEGRVELKAGLAMADFVTLHCPLNADTTNIVDKEFLKSMKPTAALINTSRGGLVQEDALLEALDSGVISKAYLDVLKTEPPEDEYSRKLCLSDKAFITPHIAWSTAETRRRLEREVVANVEAFLRGEKRNRVE